MKYFFTNIKIKLIVFNKFKKLEIVKEFKKNVNEIRINFIFMKLINLNYIIIFKI
jgi:hypothetical protein